MKLIRLSLSRVWDTMTNHRLTFVIFFLGAMLSSFVFLYFYGNAMKQDIAVTENRVEYRMYMVSFSENVPITEEQLHLLDRYGVKDVQAGCSVTLPEETLAKLPGGTVPRVYALLNNGERLTGNEGGRDMTEEQLAQTGLLADKNYGTDCTELVVNGIPFPVLGSLEHTGGMLIVSIPTYLRFFGAVDYLLYVTEDILTKQEQEEALQLLEEAFPTMSGYLAPDFFQESDREEEQGIQVHAGLMYVVSLLSFLFLFQYLQDQSRGENSIYQMVGCKRSVLFAVVLMEVAVLAAAAGLITCLIHAAFYDSIFCKLNMTETYIPYSAGDYLTIGGITVGLAMVTSLPFLVACLRAAPIGLKNKYEI